MVRIVALMTVHNRASATERLIEYLWRETSSNDGLELSLVIVDAGSTDETEALLARWAAKLFVRPIRVPSNVYWAEGMSIAESNALDAEQPDHLLWLNNDVTPTPDLLPDLLAVSSGTGHSSIIVGAMLALDKSATTYSGLCLRKAWRISSLQRIEPSGSIQKVDAFNGNVVLVPRSVYTSVGRIDGKYGHALADLDYGLRARSLGFPSYLAPGWYGSCDRNSGSGTWTDSKVSRHLRLRLLFSTKGHPYGPTKRFFVRNNPGPRFLAYVLVIASYIRPVLAILRGRDVRS